MAAARFDALVERPLAALSEEQRAAAALLGLDEEAWAALGARARKLDEAELKLRQYVPQFRYNAIEDELHKLQEQLGGEDDRPGGRVSPTGTPMLGGRKGRRSSLPGMSRTSPTQESRCIMCALAYVAEINAVETNADGHISYSIQLSQSGTVVTVLHKRYSEFAALRSMLTNGLSHSEEPEPEPEPAPPDGAAGGDEDPSVLVRGSSSGESLSSYRSIVKMASFPSKAPLRSAGSGQKLAEARRPQLAKWLNLVIKLARMEPVINAMVLSWLGMDGVRDLSRLAEPPPLALAAA